MKLPNESQTKDLLALHCVSMTFVTRPVSSTQARTKPWSLGPARASCGHCMVAWAISGEPTVVNKNIDFFERFGGFEIWVPSRIKSTPIAGEYLDIFGRFRLLKPPIFHGEVSAFKISGEAPKSPVTLQTSVLSTYPLVSRKMAGKSPCSLNGGLKHS